MEPDGTHFGQMGKTQLFLGTIYELTNHRSLKQRTDLHSNGFYVHL